MYTFQLAEVHADLQRHKVFFFFLSLKSKNELRLVLISSLAGPPLWTDVKPLHYRAEVSRTVFVTVYYLQCE